MIKITRKRIMILFGLMIILVSCFLFAHFNSLNIRLVGSDLVLEYGSFYEELGAQAFYGSKDISDKIVIKNNIDINKIGSYEVEYSINYGNISKKIVRKVKVVDTERPNIVLNGDEVVYLTIGDVFDDAGVVATDNYDGNLNDLVEVSHNIDENKEGSYEVVYKVKDSSGNEVSVSRKVIYRKKINITKYPQIAVLNYHFFYDSELGERCNESICTDVKDFKEQLEYLKENNFKTLTMEEFRSWMYGEIDIPEKSVLITIDDGGNGVGKDNGNKVIPLLEEYKMHATLFLVSAWWSPSNYESDYLDIESHTYDMHLEKVCSGVTRGAKMLCSSYGDVINDLKTSISIIGSNTAFCYPFYAYNDSVIKAVKEVGFKLAFVGGNRKVNRFNDKYRIPRYVVYKYTTIDEFKKMVN